MIYTSSPFLEAIAKLVTEVLTEIALRVEIFLSDPARKVARTFLEKAYAVRANVHVVFDSTIDIIRILLDSICLGKCKRVLLNRAVG